MPRRPFRPRAESLESRMLLRTPFEAPSLGPPPSPGPAAIWVDTVAELQSAVRNAQSGQTIVVEPGTYDLTSTLFVGRDRQVTGVTIRGATDDFNDVVIRGRGMENRDYGGVPHGISVWNAQDVTIANLSIGAVYYHPIDLQGQFGAERVHIYHVRVFDGGEQLVKSNAGGGGVDDSTLEYSLLEYTAGPPVTDHGGGTGYTGGLHAHEADRWAIRHNLFRNFHTPDTTQSWYNPVVLMWNNSSETIAEGNTFIDVDRAIAFGLIDKAGGFDHQGGVIRNNVVYLRPGLFSADRRAGADAQVLVYDSPGTRVSHNTVLTNGNSPKSIEVRWATTGVEFRNNLADARLASRDGGVYTQSGNYLTATPSMFVDPDGGDFHLVDSTATRASVIDRVDVLAGAADDFDGQGRPIGPRADIGADEWRGSPPLANPDEAVTDEDVAVSVPVLANDTDPEGDPLTVTGVTQGANGSVAINADGTVTYSPRADFHGTDSFTYTIGDGRGGASGAVVTVTIRPVNDAPIAVNDSATTSRDEPVTIAVLANDRDPDGDPLTLVGATQGANGSVTINADGTVTYKPRAGFVGTDTFTYTVSDGQGGTAVATVTVTVGKKRRPRRGG